jgi:hypothetical protein
LKQKEFNVSEARKQAEITARHVEIADQSQKQGQRQVTLAEATMAQAQETARQGKTVMLFTVVTIIFVRASIPLLVLSADPNSCHCHLWQRSLRSAWIPSLSMTMGSSP